MSLSVRGLLIAFPIVALIIGGMAFLTYRAAIGDFRGEATAELLASNETTATALRRELSLVAETQRRANAIMTERLAAAGSSNFEEIFARSPDGAFHTRNSLWEGQDLDGAVRLRGFGGFVASPAPSGLRRRTVMAAFDTLKAMASGLPREIESLYFFSPVNDLLIYAPQRPDRLTFYRTAPADFDFQDAEFSEIMSPRNNPEGAFRCTSLQTPIYDDSGQNWTTGCMLPIRVDGRYLGAWGISIPLRKFTEKLRPPPPGAMTVIASRDGKLIHRTGLTAGNSDGLAANIDMTSSSDPMMRKLAAYVAAAPEERFGYSKQLNAYISAERLEAPDWIVLTILPEQALSDRAFSIARRVIGVALGGVVLLGLILTAVFHRAVATRIAALAKRANGIAAAGDLALSAQGGDEIDHLQQAFDKMEERLEQARSRESRSFDALVDAARGYAMALYDRHGRLVRANAGAITLFGAEGVEALGAKFGLGKNGLELGRSDLAAVKEGAIVERELADGGTAWLEETLIPLTDEEGKAFGTAYIAHDLTAFREAQRETEKTLLYLEMAQSSAQAGHFALDPRTMKISLSVWLQERLGLEQPSLWLSDVPALIDESVREETMAAIADAIAAKTEFAFETLAIGADGHRFSAQLRGTAVFERIGTDEQPALIGYHGILQDVSDQKAAAQALEQALDEAKREARARSDVLAVLSHEIRTPISGIMGLIDQVRRERSETERSRALTLIEHSSEALLQTLDATVNRTRAEREAPLQTNESFSPAELIERVAELFRPLARRKGLAIDTKASIDDHVVGNSGRIQQILANFVSNAVKFTSTGGIVLSVRPPEEGRNHWTFTVADTGGGISPERMKTIFEPFGGSGADTLGRKVGSGLGLSITRQLATELGGTVEAAANEGGGTRMIVRLPLQGIDPNDETQASLGTFVANLSQASLAIKAEALAEQCGFTVADEPEADEPDVVVSDDPEFLAQSDADCKILIVEDETPPLMAGMFAVRAADLLETLPNLLEQERDD